jgi:hypothetical protein
MLKKILAFVAITVVATFIGAVAFAKSIDYVFKSVEMNESTYTVQIGSDRFEVPASEINLIAKYLNVKSPEDLTGKSFTSRATDAVSAVDRLRMDALHDGKYTPPAPDQFFDQLAQGLAQSAKGKCPSTKDIADDETIFRAMQTAFETSCAGAVKTDFVESLNKKIQKYDPAMSVVVAESKELDGVTFSCGGEYFILKNKEKPIMKFSLAPAANAFDCSQDSKVIASRTGIPSKSSPVRMPAGQK